MSVIIKLMEKLIKFFCDGFNRLCRFFHCHNSCHCSKCCDCELEVNEPCVVDLPTVRELSIDSLESVSLDSSIVNDDEV